jgi:hypothetical protein
MTEKTTDDLHPLVKKGLDSKPPIAKLIGFEVEQISQGRAVIVLEAGPQHANPMALFTGLFCAVSPMRQWEWRLLRLWSTTNRSQPSISR